MLENSKNRESYQGKNRRSLLPFYLNHPLPKGKPFIWGIYVLISARKKEKFICSHKYKIYVGIPT